MIEDIQSKITDLGSAYSRLEGIVAVQQVSQKKLMNVTGDLTKVMEVQTNLLTKAQQVTQKVAKTTTSTSTTTEDFAKAITDSVKAILEQKEAAAEAEKAAKDFGHGLTATGQPITEFNKRTELVSTTIRRLRDEYGILQFDLTRPETFQIYSEEGGNRAEFLAEFISNSREEISVFGVEAAKARKVMYGFLPPGMFRMLNKFSSILQFTGGFLRRNGDNAEENNNILGNTIKIMRKLTKEGKGINPFKDASKSFNELNINVKKAQATLDATEEKIKEKEKELKAAGKTDKEIKRATSGLRIQKKRQQKTLDTATQEKDAERRRDRFSKGLKGFQEAIKENSKAMGGMGVLGQLGRLIGKTPLGTKSATRGAFDRAIGVDPALIKGTAEAQIARDEKIKELKKQGITASSDSKTKKQFDKAMEPLEKALEEAVGKQKDAREEKLKKLNEKVGKFITGGVKGAWNVIKFVFKMAVKYLVIGGMALIAIGVIATTLLPNIIDHFGLFFEMFMGLIGVFMPFVSMIGEGLGRIIDGFIEGDLEEIIAGVFDFAVGVIAGLGVVILTLGAFLLSASISFLSGLFKTIYEFLTGGSKGFLSFLGRALTLVLAVLIGIKVATMFNSPAYMAVAIMGILFVVLKKVFKSIGLFAEGGVVNTPLQIVGEKGPELVNLPRGSRVHSNADSRKMVGGGGSVTNNINVTINAKDTSKSEMRRIAKEIGNMINKEINRGVSSSTTR